jgi:DNA-binding MarR family transcriptional regulator
MLPQPTTEPPCENVDSSFLRSLLGYNTRRATLKIFDIFQERTQAYGLKPVEFAVLSLIGRNPNISHGQLCTELALLAPNLTKILQKLSRKHLIQRLRPESDKRAIYLKLTDTGQHQLQTLEQEITQLERDSAANLSDEQLAQLIGLLQQIYFKAPPR